MKKLQLTRTTLRRIDRSLLGGARGGIQNGYDIELPPPDKKDPIQGKRDDSVTVMGGATDDSPGRDNVGTM